MSYSLSTLRLEDSFAMNGGDGPNSYTHNSKYQVLSSLLSSSLVQISHIIISEDVLEKDLLLIREKMPYDHPDTQSIPVWLIVQFYLQETNHKPGMDVVQRTHSDQAKVLLSCSILKHLVLPPDSKSMSNQVFCIADLGCSVDPNTFASIETIIKSVVS